MLFKIIQHPETFKAGTRVLMLKGRHKDGLSVERTIIRVTHRAERFDESLGELNSLAIAGERIYASATARDMKQAVREFKRRQLDADYDDDPNKFYRHLDDRWVASLMQPTSQIRDDKLWLFDCDNVNDTDHVLDELSAHYDRGYKYQYASKSGTHILTLPFNKTLISERARQMIHTNPIILWGY